MNVSITKTKKRNRLVSFSFIINALVIIGALVFLLPGCEKDDKDKMYNLLINVNPAGAGTIAVDPVSDNGMFKEGSKVTLTAKPAVGHSFKEWAGDASGSSVTIEIIMDGNKTIDANFDKMYSLSLNVTPVDAGTIEVTPVSDNGMFKEGSKVTLTVKPSVGHRFKQWSGDITGSDATIEVIMDGNKTIAANFSKMFNLRVNVTPADAGTVEVSPKSDNGIYEEGSKVTLVAKSALGYFFKEWSGDASAIKDTLEVVMDGNKAIDACFSIGINETFDDDSANFFLNDQTGRWSAKDGAYAMTGTGANSWGYSWYDYNGFDNFEYSVDVKAVGNTSISNAVGIYFRSQNIDPQQNSYKVAIAPAGQWYLCKQVNGVLSWIKAWTPSSDIKTGLDQTNNLKVVCSGESIEVFINGVSQGVFADTEFASGYAGVIGYDVSGFANTFVFDNITLKKIVSKKAKSTHSSAFRVDDTDGMDPRFCR